VLKYLQFYNLTCNECGGVHSSQCISYSSCTLPLENCTCSDAPSRPALGHPTEGIASLPANAADVPAAAAVANPAAAAPDAAAAAAAPRGGEAQPAATRRRLQQQQQQQQQQETPAAPAAPGTCNYTQFAQ